MPAMTRHQQVAAALNEHIAPLFGAGVRITLLAHVPGDDEQEIVLSNDSVPEVLALFARWQTRETAAPVVERAKRR